MRGLSFWLSISILAVLLSASAQGAEPRPPNVVFILTDNQGAWTLGCYGNKDIRTPNIDRLAKEGVRFTNCYSSNAVCSPTRATFLTGLIPSQHGVHCYLSEGEPQTGPKAYDTIGEFRNLPRILSESGYTCGLSGKWHLGDNMKPQDGFTYWVTMPVGHTTDFYDANIIEDGKIRKEPKYLTDFWTDHGIRFIEQNKDKPFFLYLAYNGPYGLGESLLKPSKNRHAEYYDDKELKCFPREKMNPWLHGNKKYLNNIQAMRRVAAEVSGVDDGVGRIVDTLKKHGLTENTLVIYSSDQGWCGGQHGIWGMGDHTRPLTAFDDEIHIPLIYRQPGVVPAGKTSDILVSNYDFVPTVLEYLGMKDKTPQKPPLPGRSYVEAVKGNAPQWDNVVFFEFENVRVVRTLEWKFIQRFPKGPNELYDLKVDPGERHNLADEADRADTRKKLAQQLENFFKRYADPRYDLWKDGTSKAKRIVKE